MANKKVGMWSGTGTGTGTGTGDRPDVYAAATAYACPPPGREYPDYRVPTIDPQPVYEPRSPLTEKRIREIIKEVIEELERAKRDREQDE